MIKIMDEGEVAHVYWGQKLDHFESLDCKDMGKASGLAPLYRNGFSLGDLPQEYSSNQSTDFREPSYVVRSSSGSTMSSLKFKSHEIYNGKAALEGLPATYVDSDSQAQTLLLTMTDEMIGLEVILSYTVFENSNAIARSVKFTNNGSENISILRALSVNIDFVQREFEVLHLAGSWLRERSIIREPLRPGTKTIQSKRGSSSHQHNPFMALLESGVNEDHGDVYGFSFVYSGNFIAQAEVDQHGSTRVQLGINPHDFTWKLEPSKSFQCPEVILVYSCNGMGGMSRTYHNLYRKHLCRGKYRDISRPILANSWEGMYFDYTADDIVDFAGYAKDLGIELVVMDDGWFGNRDAHVIDGEPTSGLGDWYANKKKIPDDISGLAIRVEQKGIAFGLWIEPEMISENSELYRKHPDWCMRVAGRKMHPSRYQHILDLSRKDVCDYLSELIANILRQGPIAYVKWDMNRYMTNIGSAAFPADRQQEIGHRYILGLYGILERLVSEFSDVLFESCSGGGGRFDPGMLYYMPQTWTSDNSDAVSRVGIQLGTSIVYPAISMGCHVSAVPNHQTGRITPLKLRADVAMMGNLGYELDLGKLTSVDSELIKEQISFYKCIRNTVQFGDMYRLNEMSGKCVHGVQYISPDRMEIVVFVYMLQARPNSSGIRIKLKGLCPDGKYTSGTTSKILSASELMQHGLDVKLESGDHSSSIIQLSCCKTKM